MIRKVREKCPETGSGSRKKQAFPSKRIQEKHWKHGNGMKKFLSTGQKNIPMKRKNLENGWSGWKNNRAFFAGRQQKNAGKEAGRNQKIYQAYPEKAWKTYGRTRINPAIWGRSDLQKQLFLLAIVKEKSKKVREPDKIYPEKTEKTCWNFLRFLYKKYSVLYKFLKVLYKNMKQKRQKPRKTTAMFGEKTAASKENNNSVRKTTITASEENDSKIREKHAQKSYGFCTKA